jgi:hypothetical protein
VCDKSGSQEKDKSIPGRHAAELIPLSLNYNYNCFYTVVAQMADNATMGNLTVGNMTGGNVTGSNTTGASGTVSHVCKGEYCI